LKIDINKLIEIIIKEVVAELSKRGIEIENANLSSNIQFSLKSSQRKGQSLIINMNEYKTPVLTESKLESIDPGITEIVIPKGTVITPGAKDIIKRRNLIINSQLNS
jgi:hypothetical protein